MFFPKGSSEPIEYEGERTEQAFVDFLNEKCGTKRAVGGELNSEVSLVLFKILLYLYGALVNGL